jgi:hypothetical protein
VLRRYASLDNTTNDATTDCVVLVLEEMHTWGTVGSGRGQAIFFNDLTMGRRRTQGLHPQNRSAGEGRGGELGWYDRAREAAEQLRPDLGKETPCGSSR